jgi:hypothetical protein
VAQRINSWVLVLFAAAGAAGIYGVLMLNRMWRDPSLGELLQRLPAENALTVHIDLAAIRKAGLAKLLEETPVAEEPDYRRFVNETGFDWKTDLDAVTASRSGNSWYFFVRGRFEMDKLREFALSRGGICRNGVCDVAGSGPGRRVSFFPLNGRVLVMASSNRELDVYTVSQKNKPMWEGGVPEGPAWVSLNGSFLAGDPELPAGGRLFGKVLAETKRTTFTVSGVVGALELKMRAQTADAAAAAGVKAQLEGVTAEFKKYFERMGQAGSAGDLSGLLLSGEFGVNGVEVTGRWPLHVEFLKKLAVGGL